MSTEEWSKLTEVLLWVSAASTAAVHLALLIAIATIVRRRRPEGATLLVVWAAAALVASVLGFGWSLASTRLAAVQSVEAVVRQQALNVAMGIPIAVVLPVLLLLGILRLSRDEQPR